MHELFDAIIFLFDVLLDPFTKGGEPKKKWVKVVRLLIVIAMLGSTGLWLYVHGYFSW